MYYGHASWIVLVVFGSMFVMRAFSSQRRRGARRGTRVPGSSFAGDDRSGPALGRPSGSPGSDAAGNGTPPGWFTDPFCKHDQRYWSGSAWTEHVSDDGVPGTDPPPPSTLRDAG
jgi:hypothetical protein